MICQFFTRQGCVLLTVQNRLRWYDQQPPVEVQCRTWRTCWASPRSCSKTSAIQTCDPPRSGRQLPQGSVSDAELACAERLDSSAVVTVEAGYRVGTPSRLRALGRTKP